ncbi:unnamed protein product [Mytilus coruscus]|uniref:Endonuclease/exonuclease/phosphatase domain-containing protein n=1 Tax=Mytilus coruscus TaxID=42192 RepID=A0A6J8BB98_MYTCO|nr:unnamed protein product [Mytilus coruscus]
MDDCASIIAEAGNKFSECDECASIIADAGNKDSECDDCASIIAEAGNKISECDDCASIIAEAGNKVSECDGCASIIAEAGNKDSECDECASIKAEAGNKVSECDDCASIIAEAGNKVSESKPRPDLDFDNEALWLEINFPSYKLLHCIVYRQPSNNNTFWDKFHESIENALSYSPNVVITGDVNVDFLTDYSHKIFDIMRLNGLKNVINEPTRFCATRQSLLDPILVSDSCDVYDCHVIQIDCTYSDHDGTIIFLNNLTRSTNNTTYKRMIWDYRNADFDKCNELIATFDWESIINAENSMDQNCKNFTNKLLEYVNDCIPQKEVTI